MAEMPNLDCTQGPLGSQWAKIRAKVQEVFSKEEVGFVPISNEKVTMLLHKVMDDYIEPIPGGRPALAQADDTCGLGKLLIQLLSMLTVTDVKTLGTIIVNAEQLASPLLTLLLDMPWAHIRDSGWPFFGLLAQMNIHQTQGGAGNDDATDGIDNEVGGTFMRDLLNMLSTNDMPGLRQRAMAFLDDPKSPQSSALGVVSALLVQAATTPSGSAGHSYNASEMLIGTQVAMRSLVRSPNSWARADSGEEDGCCSGRSLSPNAADEWVPTQKRSAATRSSPRMSGHRPQSFW